MLGLEPSDDCTFVTLVIRGFAGVTAIFVATAAVVL